MDRLLNIVNELLPRGDNEWQLVTDQYNLNRPREFPEREKDSIRNKFKALKNVKKPTGDPTIPASVRRAKQIQRRIEDRISVETADDGVNHNEIEDDLDDDVSINYEGLNNDESNNNVEDAEAILEEDNGLGESSGNIASNRARRSPHYYSAKFYSSSVASCCKITAYIKSNAIVQRPTATISSSSTGKYNKLNVLATQNNNLSK